MTIAVAMGTGDRDYGLRSRNVFPRPTYGSPACGNYGYAKTLCQFLQRGGRRFAAFIANDAHRFFGQLGQMLFLTMSPTAPALLLFVIGVDLVIPQEQVRGPDARAVVAVMQDQAACGDRPIVQLPSHTMRRESSATLAFRLSALRLYHPVSGIAFPAKPNPTSGLQSGMDRPILIYRSPELGRIWFPELTGSASNFHTAQDTTD